MSDLNVRPIFGTCPIGIACEHRRAAYAVIFDSQGRVAVVRAEDHWFLPGGGSNAGESPDETVLREIQEETGFRARIIEPFGEAIQYFRDSTRCYEMSAAFFKAELIGAATSIAEHELVWLDPQGIDGFFHECHKWAVVRVLGHNS